MGSLAVSRFRLSIGRCVMRGSRRLIGRFLISHKARLINKLPKLRIFLLWGTQTLEFLRQLYIQCTLLRILFLQGLSLFERLVESVKQYLLLLCCLVEFIVEFIAALAMLIP